MTQYFVNPLTSKVTGFIGEPLLDPSFVACSIPPDIFHKWVDGAWVIDAAGIELRNAALMKSATSSVQKLLDARAVDWGYTNMVYAASYAASTNPKFLAEAQALIAWRDRVWEFCHALQEGISAGTQTMPPDISAFLSMLPEPPDRP